MTGLNSPLGVPVACRVCGDERTIRAHIVPAAFGRLASAGNGKPLKTIARDSRKVSNSGIWDATILCHACDRVLGGYDKYAIELWRSALTSPPDFKAEEFEIEADASRVVKFLMAILWRASVTTRPEFSTVRLGPYEPKFKRTIFGPDSAAPDAHPRVMISRYRSRHLPMHHMYSMPIYSTLGGANCYVFALGGCRIVVKVDKRPFPRFCERYIINGRDVIRGLMVDFEDTTEFAAMRDVIHERWRADAARRHTSLQ
ncbi:MAG TPA: hypothetical protein VMH39_11180 [Gemmatimonadaceae bacterium]|nr:hypothetical protein [Gemmatimonadaceae bacterium]